MSKGDNEPLAGGRRAGSSYEAATRLGPCLLVSLCSAGTTCSTLYQPAPSCSLYPIPDSAPNSSSQSVSQSVRVNEGTQVAGCWASLEHGLLPSVLHPRALHIPYWNIAALPHPTCQPGLITCSRISFLPCSYLSLRTGVLAWHPSSPNKSLAPTPYSGFLHPHASGAPALFQHPAGTLIPSGIRDACHALLLPRTGSTSSVPSHSCSWYAPSPKGMTGLSLGPSKSLLPAAINTDSHALENGK